MSYLQEKLLACNDSWKKNEQPVKLSKINFAAISSKLSIKIEFLPKVIQEEMKSSIKNFFGQKPRTGESSNPKMEQNEDITEIKGLDDRCVDALDSIERDAATASSLPSAPLPPLNEDVFRRFVKTLDDDCAIAIAFLTNPVPEQV